MSTGYSIYGQAPTQSEAVNISSTDYTFTSKGVVAIYVGGTGAITARLQGDAADSVWSGIPAGTYLQGCFSIVRKTGTTATLMVGCITRL